MTRREFRLISGTGATPTIEDITRRKGARRHFKTIHAGGTARSLVAASTTSIERYITFAEQLAPETGLENKAWVATETNSAFVLKAMWDPGATPTSTHPSTGYNVYDQKMRGIRFKIDGYNGLWNWTSAVQGQFTSYNVPVTGRSAVLPSNDSHMLLNVSQIEIPNGGFNHYWYFLDGGAYTQVFTTHYRIWINGVDKTGIVTLGTPFPHVFGNGTFNGMLNRRRGGMMSPVSITAGSYKSQSVWFDIWVTVQTVKNAARIGADPSLASSYRPVCEIDFPAAFDRARFNSANANAKRYVGDQYKITFADNGPGALSELNVATGGGWTLVSATAGFKLIKPGTGSIELNWATEAPVLTCSIDAKIGSPAGASGNMRYLPSGTEYQHRNKNNTVVQYGTWNPQGSTVFNQVARAFGSTYYTKNSAEGLAGFFTGFPSTITVEKI